MMYSLGFCYWDLPAALLLVAVLVIYLVKRHRLKKTCEFYEQELERRELEKSNTENNGKNKNQAYIDALNEEEKSKNE